MAEVAKNVVRESLTDEDDGSTVEPAQEISLQELIDTELALRVVPTIDTINNTTSSPIKSNNCFTNEFLIAEREHSSAELISNNNHRHNNLSSSSSPIMMLDEHDVITTTAERFDILTLNEKNQQQNHQHNNHHHHPSMNGDSEEHNNTSSINDEHVNIIELDDHHSNDDWTTVEEVAREIVGHPDDEVDDNDEQHIEIVQEEEEEEQQQQEQHIENCHVVIEDNEQYINDNTTKQYTEYVESNTFAESIVITTTTISSATTTISSATTNENSEIESVETSVTEKKKKKKTATENGEVALTKSKKTKKSKKTEEKENHISVITNGHGSNESEPVCSPNSTIHDDELSNVCVKNLKLTYVNEATKSYSESRKPSEIPVPPPIPIRELTRSFGDICKACETAELTESNKYNPWRARSLGDLTRIDKQPAVVTGVNVKLLKSSFSKFDQLSKKVLHVRSSDPAKASKTFSQGGTDAAGNPTCKACNKTVFAMEQIKAERAVWHKNCFRCHTCNKQLTVDIYSSHEGELYCKPHFKELFKPKAIIDDEEPVRRRKPEMIIRENQPLELPPEVVRASDKPDLGLQELSSLDVKSRFQVFEKQDTTDTSLERSPTAVSVKRSSSILSKLAKFQKKGMDIGVSDEALNGFVYEESESSEEEDDEDEEEEKGIVKCRKKMKERPVSFTKIDDVKKNWESQQDMMTRREEMREQRKEELQQIRSRLFMGKQGKMKELYEQAVAESEGKVNKKDVENDIIKSERARVVREKFEKGEPIRSEDEDGNIGKAKGVEEDMSVFEEGISKKSRSIFLEMDANAVKTQQNTVPSAVPPPRDSMVIKKGRETESPEREIYRDPDVIRADDKVEDEKTILKSQTASKMLSMFRQLEEQKEVVPEGLKPKKCFTPPPDYKESAGNSEDESDDEDEDDEDEEEEEESETENGIIKSSYKVKDEFLEKARNTPKAKQLAAKFEHWKPEEQSNNNAITMLDSEHASIDSTKSLRAKFESLKTEQPKEKSRPKVNRFVETGGTALCASCGRKVYPLEKVETNGKVYHKACFRCSYCKCVLRMDSYTLNNDQLYCLPHYKQLFITKGNYDEGFGSDQHKRKWDSPTASPTTC